MLSFRFVNQPLKSGLYEPEGIYLTLPFAGAGRIAQPWGAHAVFYGQYQYNGVQLQGHTGVDFAVEPMAQLLAVDQGRVVEISHEPGGLERYVKLEHRWGESLYGYVGQLLVESGQIVSRGVQLAAAAPVPPAGWALLHFAIRIAPINRFDGFGGFTDPLPYLNPADLATAEGAASWTVAYTPHAMAEESPHQRRP